MKKLVSFFVSLVTAIFFSNLHDSELFSEYFHEKQYSTFHVEYEETDIQVGMIGDILLHYPLYNYESYLPSFEPIREELQSLDLLMANQESIPAGSAFGYSGYPNFSSPVHIISDLMTVGVDVISMANNHTLDQKEAGVLAAIENMNNAGMPYIGASKSVEDYKEQRILDIKGVNFGFLSYTYGTNGHPIPSGKDYLVNQIDPVRIIADIKALKKETDIVIVSIHWGNEYELEQNDKQKQLAQTIANAGADIIFGHHPHVIQPYEIITTSSGHQTHIFYSLGNFFSAQNFDYTNIGGIAKLTIVKKTTNGSKKLSIKKPTFFATAVIEGEPFRIYPLKDVESKIGQSEQWVQEHVFKK